MFAHPAKPILVLALLAVAGCVTVPERDPVIEDARVAVFAARSNPQVGTYATAEVELAVVTLRDADDLAARGGSISEVHRLALLAQQRAALAQDTARLRIAEAALAVQRTAREAQLQADLSRRQAESAQLQAAAAQRQAEDAQRQAAASQLQAQALQLNTVVVPDPVIVDLTLLPTARGLVVTLDDTMFDPGSAQLRSSSVYTNARSRSKATVTPRAIAVSTRNCRRIARWPFRRHWLAWASIRAA